MVSRRGGEGVQFDDAAELKAVIRSGPAFDAVEGIIAARTAVGISDEEMRQQIANRLAASIEELYPLS